MNKNRKSRYYLEDRISRLPEEILLNILSFLPLKDAATTSVLSKRWRYFWRSMGRLNFDGEKTMMHLRRLAMDELKIDSHDYEPLDLDPFPDPFPDPCPYLDGDELELERCNYINWVHNVINQHVGDIDQFRVYFDLDRSVTSTIDTWIEFALKKRVQVLELELLELCQIRVASPCYILRQELLDGCVGGIKSLKVLNLKYVKVDGEIIEYLLANCPLLEQLTVHGSSKVVSLRVAGPSLALKHLELHCCRKIKSVEIHDALQLVSFRCSCYELTPLKLVISNVPKLVDVYLHSCGKDYLGRAFTALSCCLSQLQILQLETAFHGIETGVYPMLANLKQLTLTYSPKHNGKLLLRLIPFLMACPHLHRLVLKFIFHDDNGKYEFPELVKPAGCLHCHVTYLKELEIMGYVGRKSEVELIIYLVENAFSLDKIIINPCAYYRQYACTEPKCTRDIELEEVARDHAMRHLKEKVPSHIKFICL